MEALPPNPPLSGAPITTTTTAINPTAAVYPESIDSSPRSRQTDSLEADPPPPLQKLRLMCSYGGHIVPRPHDKTLCYIGGDTRIIVIDRHTSLADLRHRLSGTLLHNHPFTLKYQLPNEDLDSLISVTTDEDLENMVEESDRLNNPATASSGLKNGRLRLFLFPQTSSSNIEQLLVETASAKSEDWFLNALNGKSSTFSAGASDRGFSESSSVGCLLGLDDDLVRKTAMEPQDVGAQIEGSKSGGNGNNNVNNHDVNSVPDYPMLDTMSSFGSTPSSPSVPNLPPIRVHVEDNRKVTVEDHFQQMNLGVSGHVNLAAAQKLEEAGASVAATGPVVSGVPSVVAGQPPVPIPQFQQRQATAFDLASPDSVSSEAMYQDSVLQLQSRNISIAANQLDPKPGDQSNSQIHMQPQVQEPSGYVLSTKYEQNQPQLQQFVHAGNKYNPAGPVPVASYYPIYPSQPQNHPYQPTMDQQYPFYFFPGRTTPGYNFSMQQTNYNELGPSVTSNRPQTPPAAVVPQETFTQAVNTLSKPETATGVYRAVIGSGPQLIQGPSSQHQAQYTGFTQIHHPSQSVAPFSAVNSTYAYEFTDPNRAQVYYNQALPPQLAANYQTLMSPAPAGVVRDASCQVPLENIKQQGRNLQQ